MSDLPIGQLFIFGFDGFFPDEDVKKIIQIHKPAGVILFKRNISSLLQIIDLNRSIINSYGNNYPPFISVDQEGGIVSRLKGICTDFPPMKHIGNSCKNGQEQMSYKAGAIIGRELLALGFNLNFAPVSDVDTNEKNPIIGDRSFSTKPLEAAKYSAAFIKGMQGSGIAACSKHFPGHGDTYIDSHLALPLLDHDLQRLSQVEFIPFEHAVKADVASIMTAHIKMPLLDKEHPATLSISILQKLLREKLGYHGIIVSDDLEMKAISENYDIKEAIYLGLKAGIDLFLICSDLKKAAIAIEHVHRLVKDNQIKKEQILCSIERIKKVKKKFIGKISIPDPTYAKKIVRSKPHLSFVQGINSML